MKFSNISQLHPSKVIRPKEQPLRPGQIVRGEVLKLYPNNRAAINLGGNRLVAHLEVGLELGARYYFQVAKHSNVLKLRVVGDKLQKNESLDLSRLLKELGLKENRSNLKLLQMLTRHAIPFEKTELLEAAQLLKGEKNKTLGSMVLTEMIARKLPLTSQVFISLITSRKSTITDQLQAVIQQLSTTAEKSAGISAQTVSDLRDSIVRLTQQPVTFQQVLGNEMNQQAGEGNQTLFRSLQGLGFISPDTSFSSWAREESGTQLPPQMNGQKVFETLQRIERNRAGFLENIQNVISRWNGPVKAHELTSQPLSQDMRTDISRDIRTALAPFTETSPVAREPLTSDQAKALIRNLETLIKPENIALLLGLRKQSVLSENAGPAMPQAMFHNQLRETITALGLNYESRLIREKDPSGVLQTIKGLLLKLGAGQEGAVSEQQARLFQHIQGLQLQSVSENAGFIQANLQIPAERLGLIKDLRLEFEGRKNENGKIYPDYCRILFYLELGAIGETVMDLNIQNRAIGLTVFNNTKGMPARALGFREMLEMKLEPLSYRLSSLTFKKLEEKDRSSTRSEEARPESSMGVDFRI